MKTPFSFGAFLATAISTSLISISAQATMFEIACKKSDDDALPEFMILTEDRVDYTFAAYTKATMGKLFEPRLVLHIAKGKDDAQKKTMNPRRVGEVLQTVNYAADSLELNSDLFADVADASKFSLGGADSAQLIKDGKVIGSFICHRLN